MPQIFDKTLEQGVGAGHFLFYIYMPAAFDENKFQWNGLEFAAMADIMKLKGLRDMQLKNGKS